jgi:hypothetical protein
MTVVISPNIKRESVRINPVGDIIDARTKQIIKPVEPEYVSPATPVLTETPKQSSKIDEMISDIVSKKISQKLEELVARKIAEALDKML